MNTWREIESAPKDGNLILVAKKVKGEHWRQFVAWYDAVGEEWFISQGVFTRNPTHWMPLPEPPQ